MPACEQSTLIGSTRKSECSMQWFLNSDKPHTDVPSISLLTGVGIVIFCYSLWLQRKANRPPLIYRPITLLQ